MNQFPVYTGVNSSNTITLVDIDKDIRTAEEKVKVSQEKLIKLLESGEAKLKNIEEFEREDLVLMQSRDKLIEARQIIIKREKLQKQYKKDLTFVIYLVKWLSSNPELVHDHNFNDGDVIESRDTEQIRQHITALSKLHEAEDITGVVYVMPGWLAGYSEGAADTIFKYARNLKKDEGSKYEKVVLIGRERIQSCVRVFPEESLRIVHVENTLSHVQKSPVSALLWGLAPLMDLYMFVPTFTVANRGHGRVGGDAVLKETAQMIAAFGYTNGGTDRTSAMPFNTRHVEKIVSSHPISSHVGSKPSFFPLETRIMVNIAPSLSFWESGLTNTDTLRIIVKLYNNAIKLFDESSSSLVNFSVTGPHSNIYGVMFVAQAFDVHKAIDIAVHCFNELRKDYVIGQLYRPVMAIHTSDDDLGLMMNGLCTVIGPPVRYIRKMLEFCRAKKHSVLISHKAVYQAGRFGFHLQDRDNSEIYIPSMLLPVPN